MIRDEEFDKLLEAAGYKESIHTHNGHVIYFFQKQDRGFDQFVAYVIVDGLRIVTPLYSRQLSIKDFPLEESIEEALNKLKLEIDYQIWKSTENSEKENQDQTSI